MLHLDPLTCASHAAAAASAAGRADAVRGVDCAARDLVVIAALIETTSAPGIEVRRAETDQPTNKFGTFVFVRARAATDGGGGGGGGNQQSGPIRRAQGVGSDPITLRVRKSRRQRPGDDRFRTCRRGRSSAPIDRARCEAAGLRPVRSDWTAERRRDVRHVDRSRVRGRRRHGKRDWYRLGTWPGIRPRIRRWNWRWRLPRWRGSIRTAPDQRSQAQVHERGAPSTRFKARSCWKSSSPADGCPSQIRIVRSLDRGGLDEEAVSAVAQWRFEPGRLAGAPVDVLVTIMLDFSIR